MKVRTIIGIFGFAALLATAGVTPIVPAHAQRWEDCQDRIRHAERHLDRMIERFGYRSRQAREARHELEDARDRCRRRDHHDRHDWDGPRH